MKSDELCSLPMLFHGEYCKPPPAGKLERPVLHLPDRCAGGFLHLQGPQEVGLLVVDGPSADVHVEHALALVLDGCCNAKGRTTFVKPRLAILLFDTRLVGNPAQAARVHKVLVLDERQKPSQTAQRIDCIFDMRIIRSAEEWKTHRR